MDRIVFDLQLFLDINNTKSNTLLSGTSGNDTIRNGTGYYRFNGGSNVTIKAGGGNDSIYNDGSDVLIYAESGDDEIRNIASKVIIRAGDGNDCIHSERDIAYSDGWYVTIEGGAGKDSIYSNAEYASINSGIGDDYVNNSAPHATIDLGDGNDSIFSSNCGDYYSNSHESNVKINAGSGNDWISIYRGYDDDETYNATISGGSGDDTVYMGSNAENKMIKSPVIDVGDGADFISTENALIKNVKVITGTGNDTVLLGNNAYWEDENKGYDEWRLITDSNNTISTGDGNDYIYQYGWQQNSVVNLGSGNDSIDIEWLYDSLVDGGDGDDYLKLNESSGLSLKGGKGNDIIGFYNISNKNLIQYTNGDGNDTVYGFVYSDDPDFIEYNDTLQIAGSYSTVKDGDNLIVKVGSGSITLVDVNGANIVQDNSSQITWTISGTTATGKIDGKVVATIKNLKKGTTADSLSDTGNIIKISSDALGTATVTLTNAKGSAYKLSVDEDIKSVTTPAGWNIDDTSATYRTIDITTGYVLAANGLSVSYVSKATVGKDLTTVTGLKSGVVAEDLSLSGKNVTVKNHALGTDTVAITGGYYLLLGTDVTKSVTTPAKWAIDGEHAEYTTAHISEGYVLASNRKTITHNDESGGEMVATLDGIKKGAKANAFFVKDNVIYVNNYALSTNNIITLDSEDYTLAVSGKPKSVTTAEGWVISGTTASYNTEKASVGYAVFDDGKTIEYVPEIDGGDTLVKLTGLKNRTAASALTIADNVVTIGADAIVKTAITATGEGYEYKLGSAAKITSKSKNTTLTGSAGNDTLIGSKYADYISGGEGNDYISGGNGKDTLIANGGDTLIGGTGKDLLYSNSGNNTLSGGSGADEFYFTAGNATITDYTAGTDKIYITGTFTNTISGRDVIFSVGSNTLTVKNGKNKNITVNDSTQKYSDVAEVWFADENNFATAADISEITKTADIGDIEFSAAQDTLQSTITFADK